MNSDEAETFKVISRKGGYWLEKNGWTFNLRPPEIVEISLPPYVNGIDWFIKEASSIKGISSELMEVKFSLNLFMGCDANLSYEEKAFGGWIYSLGREFLDFNVDRKIWICGQMKLYFENPPKKIFVSLESLERKAFL